MTAPNHEATCSHHRGASVTYDVREHSTCPLCTLEDRARLSALLNGPGTQRAASREPDGTPIREIAERQTTRRGARVWHVVERYGWARCGTRLADGPTTRLIPVDGRACPRCEVTP